MGDLGTAFLQKHEECEGFLPDEWAEALYSLLNEEIAWCSGACCHPVAFCTVRLHPSAC